MLLNLLISVFISASLNAAVPMQPMTDLGVKGNIAVAKKYDDYKKSFEGTGCQATGPGHRVMLTGFGLFSGVNYNISGAVVSSMANQNFWPSEVELNNLPLPISLVPENGILSPNGPGVKISNRTLRINNQDYEICFITINVNWDFAGAVFIDQATKFQPELILMTGRGGGEVSLESGAINNAESFSGYDETGRPLDSRVPKTENQPLKSGEKVLDDYSSTKTLKLTWDTRAIKKSIERKVKELGYKVATPKEARPENNYICNNVSFVMAHAAQNKVTTLVKGAVVLESPEFKTAPKIGFLHFPNADGNNPILQNYASQMYSWTGIIAEAIQSQFTESNF